MLRRTVLAMAVAFLFSVVAQPSAAEAKDALNIRVVNPVRLSTQSDPGKEVEKQLSALFGKERADLEKKQADINKQADDLKKQAAALSEKARNERVQKIQKQAADLENKGRAYSERLARVRQAIDAQLNELMHEAIKKYASKNGYDMIIDGTVVMYLDQDAKIDVTAGLIEEVNKLWKSKGGKFKLDSVKK